jgi:uroporphyrinogen decarboxylase
MQSGREVVINTLTFGGPDRLARDFPGDYGSDFLFCGMRPSPDDRQSNGRDEWGAVWESKGETQLGEVKEYPLKSWDVFARMTIPDVSDPARWECLQNLRELAEDKFILCSGISIYERIHFLRGLENTWVDIYEEPENLSRLLDVLVKMNLEAVGRYAALGADGYIFCDDWGLQDRLMISPAKWREIWKPAYAAIFKAVHDAGMFAFLHSCGYIVDILDDLIEAGLDVIHMDQQENMGLELLGRRFAGRLTFFSPVDIQKTMACGSLDDIRAYCRRMAATLGTKEGGFIPRWYADPVGAGHRQEAVDAMCEEFLRISREMYGA